MSNPNIQLLDATASTFRAVDAGDKRFYINGTLVGGYLRFEVVAELPAGERGSVQGCEFFDAMMNHCASSVTAIEGDWSDLMPELTANLNEFNQQTAAGVSREEAAKQTWTGRMAERHGFDSVTIVHALPKDAAGNYRKVFVRYHRPCGCSMNVDQDVIDDLRRMLRDGATPSQLIRHVISHHQDDDCHNLRFRLTDYFHEAFRVFLRGLPLNASDLSKDYSNSYHNQFLLHRIVQQRSHWDQDNECTWLGDLKATDEGELNDSIDLRRQPEFEGIIEHLDEPAENAIKMAMGNSNALYELVQILAALAERLQDKIDRLEQQIGDEAEPVGAAQASLD